MKEKIKMVENLSWWQEPILDWNDLWKNSFRVYMNELSWQKDLAEIWKTLKKLIKLLNLWDWEVLTSLNNVEKYSLLRSIALNNSITFYDKLIILSFIRKLFIKQDMSSWEDKLVKCLNCELRCKKCSSKWSNIIHFLILVLIIRNWDEKIFLSWHDDFKSFFFLEIMKIIEILSKEKEENQLFQEFIWTAIWTLYWIWEKEKWDKMISYIFNWTSIEDLTVSDVWWLKTRVLWNYFFYWIIFSWLNILNMFLTVNKYKDFESLNIKVFIDFVYSQFSDILNISNLIVSTKENKIFIRDLKTKFDISMWDKLKSIIAWINKNELNDPYISQIYWVFLVSFFSVILNLRIVVKIINGLLSDKVEHLDYDTKEYINIIIKLYKNLNDYVKSNFDPFMKIIENIAFIEKDYLLYQIALICDDYSPLTNTVKDMDSLFNVFHSIYWENSKFYHDDFISKVKDKIVDLYFRSIIIWSTESFWIFKFTKWLFQNSQELELNINHRQREILRKIIYQLNDSDKTKVDWNFFENKFLEIINIIFPYSEFYMLKLWTYYSNYNILKSNTNNIDHYIVGFIIEAITNYVWINWNQQDIDWFVWYCDKRKNLFRAFATVLEEIWENVQWQDSAHQNTTWNIFRQIWNIIWQVSSDTSLEVWIRNRRVHVQILNKLKNLIICENPLIFWFNWRLYFVVDNENILELVRFNKSLTDVYIKNYIEHFHFLKEALYSFIWICNSEVFYELFRKALLKRCLTQNNWFSFIKYKFTNEFFRFFIYSRKYFEKFFSDSESNKQIFDNLVFLLLEYENWIIDYSKNLALLQLNNRAYMNFNNNAVMLINVIFSIISNSFWLKYYNLLINVLQSNNYKADLIRIQNLTDIIPQKIFKFLSVELKKQILKFNKWELTETQKIKLIFDIIDYSYSIFSKNIWDCEINILWSKKPVQEQADKSMLDYLSWIFQIILYFDSILYPKFLTYLKKKSWISSFDIEKIFSLKDTDVLSDEFLRERSLLELKSKISDKLTKIFRSTLYPDLNDERTFISKLNQLFIWRIDQLRTYFDSFCKTNWIKDEIRVKILENKDEINNLLRRHYLELYLILSVLVEKEKDLDWKPIDLTKNA